MASEIQPLGKYGAASLPAAPEQMAVPGRAPEEALGLACVLRSRCMKKRNRSFKHPRGGCSRLEESELDRNVCRSPLRGTSVLGGWGGVRGETAGQHHTLDLAFFIQNFLLRIYSWMPLELHMCDGAQLQKHSKGTTWQGRCSFGGGEGQKMQNLVSAAPRLLERLVGVLVLCLREWPSERRAAPCQSEPQLASPPKGKERERPGPGRTL